MTRRTVKPPQSTWCFLGLHRWDAMDRPKTVRGVRYIATYNRCERPGCRRYPTWTLVNLERPRYRD